MDYYYSLIDALRIFFTDPIFTPLLNLLSLLILGYTAISAYRAWIESQRSNELKLLPTLGFYIRRKGLRDKKLRIRNTGYGTAYNIKIFPIRFLISDVYIVWEFNLRIPETNILIVDEERDLEINGFSDNKKVDIEGYLISILDPKIPNKLQDIKITIMFENAMGNKYITQIRSSSNELNISLQPRRFTFLKRIEVVVNEIFLYLQLLTYHIGWKINNIS